MQGLMEQLVKDIKDIPKIFWRNTLIDPPDKYQETSNLLVIDSWNMDEDYRSDDEGSDDCDIRSIRIVSFSDNFWRDNNDQRTRFKWYIPIDDNFFPTNEYTYDPDLYGGTILKTIKK
jgi:hypothetical protein